MSARWPEAGRRSSLSRTTIAVIVVAFGLVLVAAAISEREASSGSSPAASHATTSRSGETAHAKRASTGVHGHATTGGGATPTTTPPTTTPKGGGGTGQGTGQTAPTLGLYTGAGGASTAEELATTLNAPYALDYFPDDSWQDLTDPSWTLSQWAGTSFTMMWGVPMLPATGASLADGAAGDYDSLFSSLAQTLVADGQASSILLIGYDPGSSSNPWWVSTPAEALQYVAYWQQIVTAMRAVPGAQFRFEWDVAGGPSSISPASLYPGDQYVDIIATDAFDIPGPGTPAGQRWDDMAVIQYGPDWFAGFAAQHDKPFMIAKWGLVPTSDGGGGDDPTFVEQFLAWAQSKHVAAAVLWDSGDWGITLGGFPAADAVLVQLEQKGAHAAGT